MTEGDVEFMLQELGLKYRPTSSPEEENLKNIFTNMPYQMFRELAKHGARPKYRGCVHCPCQCKDCNHCGDNQPKNEGGEQELVPGILPKWQETGMLGESKEEEDD